jgi:hypothetical protein
MLGKQFKKIKWGLHPWGGKGKNLVNQFHRTFVPVLSRTVYQLITFEVLHLPLQHRK